MLTFKKLTLHNFGSYHHVELDLQTRGFCLVTGQNNYIKDNALSNGSGKSFLWSALCFALTGETISGLKNNLKNILIDENKCYTEVEFIFNKDLYKIQRIIAPRSDMKIWKNSVDISGKGKTESVKKLDDTLPILTKDLIASTILIGQGMPHKFSSFTPAGRKTLLEQLTNSDFMITDVKNKITSRIKFLKDYQTDQEKSLIANQVSLRNCEAQLSSASTELAKIVIPDFDVEISALETELGQLAVQRQELNKELDILEAEAESNNLLSSQINNVKNDAFNQMLSLFNERYLAVTTTKNEVALNIKTLSKQITDIKQNTGICPLCGQAKPNHVHIDTAMLEAELAQAQEQQQQLTGQILELEQKKRDYEIAINNQFASQLAELETKIKANISTNSTLRAQLAKLNTQETTAVTRLEKLKADRASIYNTKKYYENLIAKLSVEKNNYVNAITLVESNIEEVKEHIKAQEDLKKLAEGGFRGFLLQFAIDHLNKKAQEYSEIVFGHRDIQIYLDGKVKDKLEILYQNKIFDGLSGGEKQRVDLIIQFAIRDLLMAHRSFSCNLIVLDEITDFLDKKSCAAVMKLLEKELNTIESVFIISHHAETLDLPIDSEIHIIKNEQGISEVM